ncbi:MAG: helix-turn-helix domain-containing protein [Devosia sp.]
MAPSEARREGILDAAQMLILKHGLRGTSMEAIAKEAGIAKPTLYAYFPDKPAVFAALLERLIGAWRAEFLSALRSDGDVVQRIAAALTAKHKAARRVLDISPHADELYEEHDRGGAAQFAAFDAELAALIEAELAAAGIARARIVTQFFLAASYGIGHRAQSVAELGPALRLLAERLLRPELPNGGLIAGD